MHPDPMMDYFLEQFSAFVRTAQPCDGPPPPDMRCSKPLQVIRLYEYARAIANDDFLGLAAAPCPRGTFLFRGEVAVRCTTLGEALGLAFRYIGLVCPAAHFRISEVDEEAVIEIGIDGSDSEIARVQCLWLLIMTHRLAQWLTSSEIALNRVELATPMTLSFGDYARIFESECSFNCAANRFAFPRQFLQRRIVRTPQEFDRQIHAPFGNIIEQATLSRTWKQMVRRILRSNIIEEQPLLTIDALAGEFGVSSQTLRRRLAAEGTSYRALKADTRREAALDALSAQNTSLSEASLRAGFVEPNGLSRALRASQGISSRQLLDQIRDWQGEKTHH